MGSSLSPIQWVRSDCRKYVSMVFKKALPGSAPGVPATKREKAKGKRPRFWFTVSQSDADWIRRMTNKGHHQNEAHFLRSFFESKIRNHRYLPPSLETDLSRLIRYLRNNGELLNQIARHTNTVQRVTSAELAKAKQLAESQEKCIRAFILADDR